MDMFIQMQEESERTKEGSEETEMDEEVHERWN
jgi:hypothetical protein